MQITKKQEKDALKAYKTYFESYIGGDVETIAALLDDNYTQIGSAETEVFFDKKEAIQFLNNTIDQVAGKAEMRNRSIKTERLDGHILVVEQFDMYVLIDKEWKFYAKFRASTLMVETELGWKFVYQHSSMPDTRALDGNNIAIEKISEENQQLREAVKRRTVELEGKNRDLEIETSLERVRARAMAMRSSEGLADLVITVFKELQSLDMVLTRCLIWIFNNEDKSAITWMANSEDPDHADSYLITNHNHPAYKSYLKAWENRDPNWEFDLKGKQKDAWDYHLLTKTGLKELPKNIKKAMKDPKRVLLSGAFNKFGVIQAAGLEPLSTESRDILKRFSKVFEQTYSRFLDLQKAEEQAREAQIEAALERVRSRTLAMHKSSELSEAGGIIFKQLSELDIGAETSFISLIDTNNDVLEIWTAHGSVLADPVKVKASDHPNHKAEIETWKTGQELIEIPMPKKDFINLVRAKFNIHIADQKDLSVFFLTQVRHQFGFIGMGTWKKLTNSELAILTRFTKVFEQTYTRFLDLQKAEEQAREAHIEAALERVRSKSMAMHLSEDIGETVSTLFDQLLKVGIHKSSRSGIGILNETKNMKLWSALSNSADEVDLLIGNLDMTINPLLKKITKAWKKQDGQFYYELEGKELSDYYASLNQSKSYSLRTDLNKLPEKEFIHVFTYKHGIIYSFNSVPISEEANQVFKRFAKVFEQTYTRFLDLKKAEEQAREAQIEAALERVRAQAMAMKESSDLLDIVVTMRKEFVGLGHEAHYFWHMRWLPEKYEKAMTSGDGTRIGMVMELPRHIHGNIKLIDQWEKGVESTIVYAMDAETAVDYVDKMVALGDFKQIDHNAPGPDDIRAIGGLTFIMARTTHGEIGFSLPGKVSEPPADDLATLVHFAGVFDLAYKRFEDILNAERQTRETEIELALERVRARALAMQKPQELKEVAKVLRQEMGALGVEELETCSIYINDVEADKAECWYALKDIRPRRKKLIADHFDLNLKDTWVGREMLKFYNTTNDQASIIMKGKNRVEWIRYCEEKSIPFRGYYGEDIPERTYQLYKFSHGAIGAATPGDISEENWGLLKRAAAVFSLAYSRFKDLSQALNDLQKLKQEKNRAETALTELKSTQSQLVHAEKMASLGELTAGIAHEIQNPLNFVNNFSEVNKELIQELQEELQKGDLEEANEIAKDIIDNEEKIVHHGKRAEGIVKGMLQHSRTSSGEKELTDINELADEYLRLSYHGLRAKDKSFNANFQLALDPAMPKLKVVAQDIGRVLLNLINNAFHASAKVDKPQVVVSTKAYKDKVEIYVKDNGSGIPDDIKEKVFQPFFTTKATGEGTGLGLSLSYDIITKGHDGELSFASEEGLGTKFIITLPAKSV